MSNRENRRSFFASPINISLLVFLAVGGFYLVSEHWAHLLGAGPLALLQLVCVVMHLFMHAGGHGHGEHREHGGSAGTDRDHEEERR